MKQANGLAQFWAGSGCLKPVRDHRRRVEVPALFLGHRFPPLWPRDLEATVVAEHGAELIPPPFVPIDVKHLGKEW